jgi:hypothetical protein
VNNELPHHEKRERREIMTTTEFRTIAALTMYRKIRIIGYFRSIYGYMEENML